MAVAGCRFNFDPRDDARGATSDDGGTSITDAVEIGDGPGTDAPQTACTDAIALPLNTLVPGDSCTGFDRIDGCGPAGREEIVYKFTAPASGSYTFRAFEPTTMNISTSTAVVAPGCVTTSNCAALYGTSLTAGTTIYLAIEGGSTACTQFRMQVTNP